MDNALTPREIQSRIRSGASVEDVASESGMDHGRVEVFAGPVLAEREHIAGAARISTVRRRGESGSHRQLEDLISQRLRSRGLDPDTLDWDAWRQSNLKWRVVAKLGAEAEPRTAEFVFDAKARFSLADNADARWLIGEEPPGAPPEEENTVDFNDELALVRAVSQPTPESPGDDVPASELMHDGNEDTSQLDRLYDMLSGISEDSVRIYTGILDPVLYEAKPEDPGTGPAPEAKATPDDAPAPDHEADEPTTKVVFEDSDPLAPSSEAGAAGAASNQETTQEALVEGDDLKKPVRTRKRRAQVPSWDEIMFGGPTPK